MRRRCGQVIALVQMARPGFNKLPVLRAGKCRKRPSKAIHDGYIRHRGDRGTCFAELRIDSVIRSLKRNVNCNAQSLGAVLRIVEVEQIRRWGVKFPWP